MDSFHTPVPCVRKDLRGERRGFPLGEFVRANREKSNLIGWRQTRTTSPTNQIHFLLVRANKFAKWKTGFKILTICCIYSSQHVNAMVWRRRVNLTRNCISERAKVDVASTVVTTRAARTVKHAARITIAKRRNTNASHATVILWVPRVFSVTETGGVTVSLE